MLVSYRCTNPSCDHTTVVRQWPATREEPPDSTWGDGCEECGDPLEEEPLFDEPPERDYDIDREEARLEAQAEDRADAWDEAHYNEP